VSYIPPIHWAAEKPERVKNKRRRALYTCKQPWELTSADGGRMLMPCRKCGSCMGNRKNDLVGRMVAESLSAYDVWVLTLTYDDARLDDPLWNGAEIRIPEHVQNMIHAVRMQGERATGHRIDLSYFAVYEKGDKNGRGHWHCILFWKTDVPDAVLAAASVASARAAAPPPVWQPPTSAVYLHPEKFKQVQNDPEVWELRGGKKAQQYVSVWPHGRVTCHSLFRSLSATSNVHKSVEYCVKYVTKHKQRYLMSRDMGAAFYMSLVRSHISAGVPLNDLCYSFADQQKLPQYNDRLKEKHSIETGGQFVAKTRRRVYQIQGVMRDRCMRYAVRLHRRKIKQHFRQRMALTGATVSDCRDEIKQAMALPRIGSEAVVRQWEKMRYQQMGISPTLDRLIEQAAFDSEIADQMADAGYTGGYRQKNRVDGYSEAFSRPIVNGPAMLARERSLMKRKSSSSSPNDERQ